MYQIQNKAFLNIFVSVGSTRNTVNKFVPCILSRYSSTASDNDILQKSIVPTHHFQRSLPRLPIPKLEDSCSRYLKAQLPLLTSEEHAATTKIVKDFEQGQGKVLHNELVAIDKKNKHTSYISAPWSEMYLKDRRAVALNHNPFMAFNDDPKQEYNNQLTRATNFVVSSMKFLKTYRSGFLEPEVFHLNPKKTDNMKFRKFVRMLPEAISFYGAAGLFKAFPLDMSQFPRLFNGTRIPRAEKDELFSDTSATHLLVLRKGNFYTFEVFDKDGNILPGDVIQANLAYILNNQSAAAEYPVGVFTSQDRDLWTGMREKLLAAGNVEALKKIDSAVFALVLDDDETEDPVKLSKMFLHGDGTNRWFDKSFSLIIAKSGKSCVNFEHAWGDGVAVLRYFNEVFKDTTQKPSVNPSTQSAASVDPSQTVSKIDFKLTDEIKQSITSCRSSFQQQADSLSLVYYKHEEFGKNFLKQMKFSPDAFMQLAIQMSYFKLQNGETAATYESCSTAAFKHGRTETIRSATTATKNACQLFHDSSATVEQLKEAMNECSKVHGQLTKEAAMGQGFDRHLFSMKYLASKGDGKLPAIYQDPAYGKINHVILSTSTLSSPAVLIGGFAPVVPDGFGVGYGIDDNNLGSVITTYPGRNGAQFLECFKESVDQMHDIVQGKHFRK